MNMTVKVQEVIETQNPQHCAVNDWVIKKLHQFRDGWQQVVTRVAFLLDCFFNFSDRSSDGSYQAYPASE